jgi:hypothetical protein
MNLDSRYLYWLAFAAILALVIVSVVNVANG